MTDSAELAARTRELMASAAKESTGDVNVADLSVASEGAPVGSTGSVGSVGFIETPQPGTDGVLDDVREWLSRFVRTMHETDLDLLALWAAHTHLAGVLFTSPRLVLDSPMPGSGKTTCLEHLQRLCLDPVQMASLSSPALLTRMLDARPRTVLIDEVDRTLHPDRDGVGELLAVLNAGYKKGGARPVLIPTKEGWVPKEMPCYAPVAMAGNSPNLPEDTRSRTIRVLLLPDLDGQAEESDWELIDLEAQQLGRYLAQWAFEVAETVRTDRPPLPDGVTGRARERWAPLKRVAAAAGGRWPQVVDDLALADIAREEMDKEDGMVRDRPAVVLLRDIHEVWPDSSAFCSTADLLIALRSHNPTQWGESSSYGKPLTPQRLGRMLVSSFNVHSDRVGDSPRGYHWHTLYPLFRRLGIEAANEPTEPTGPTGTTPSDSSTGVSTEPTEPTKPTEPTGGTSAGAAPESATSATEEPPQLHLVAPPCPDCGHPLDSDEHGRICEGDE